MPNQKIKSKVPNFMWNKKINGYSGIIESGIVLKLF